MHFIRRRAGAAVVEQVAAKLRQRIFVSYMSSDGTLSKLLFVPAGGPPWQSLPKAMRRSCTRFARADVRFSKWPNGR
jgi:hypothetical protein